MAEAAGRTTWHRERFVDGRGRERTYIALDRMPPPSLIDEAKIVRFIKTHAPCSGRCPCCFDSFGTTTNSLVLHTTWHDRGDVTSVCASCASPGHRHVHA